MSYVTLKVRSAHPHTGESGIGKSYINDSEHFVNLSEEDLINAKNKYLGLKDEENGLSYHKLRMFGLIELISNKISISKKDPNLITDISIQYGSIKDQFGNTKFFSPGNKSKDPTFGLEDIVDDQTIFRNMRALYVTGGSNDVKVFDPSKIYSVMGIDNPYRNMPNRVRNLNDILGDEQNLEELCRALPDSKLISSLREAGWSDEGIAVELDIPLYEIYEALGNYNE